MRAAATMEDAEKAALTPGPLAPARELGWRNAAADESAGRGAEGIRGDASARTEPVPALSGAAKSASLAGDHQKARTYSALLLQICARADKPGRRELVDARRMVASAIASR